MYDIEEVS